MRRKELDNNAIERIFLGYTATESQVYCWDPKKNLIKNSNNVIFVEGVNDIEAPTPNTKNPIIGLG